MIYPGHSPSLHWTIGWVCHWYSEKIFAGPIMITQVEMTCQIIHLHRKTSLGRGLLGRYSQVPISCTFCPIYKTFQDHPSRMDIYDPSQIFISCLLISVFRRIFWKQNSSASLHNESGHILGRPILQWAIGFYRYEIMGMEAGLWWLQSTISVRLLLSSFEYYK